MIGRDTIDNALLAQLRKQPRDVATLARLTRLSPRTVAYRLHRLRHMNIVQHRKGKGRQRIWGLHSGSLQTKNPITIYRDDDMIRALMLLTRVPRGSTIYSFEGYDFVIRQLRKTHPETVRTLQQSYRRKKVLIKCITHKKTCTYVGQLPPLVIEAHRKRRTISYYSTRSSLLGSAGYIITRHFILIINEAKRYSIVIRDPHVVDLMRESAAMLFESIEHIPDIDSINLNWLVEHILNPEALTAV